MNDLEGHVGKGLVLLGGRRRHGGQQLGGVPVVAVLHDVDVGRGRRRRGPDRRHLLGHLLVIHYPGRDFHECGAGHLIHNRTQITVRDQWSPVQHTTVRN